MDRAGAASRPAKRRPSRDARRVARQIADIVAPRAIIFEKTSEDTVEPTYVEVPLKPGQLSGPVNMFAALFEGEGEESASSDDDGESAEGDYTEAPEGDGDDHGESAEGDYKEAAEGDCDDDDEGAAGDKAAAAEGDCDDDDEGAEGDISDKAAAAEGDHDEA